MRSRRIARSPPWDVTPRPADRTESVIGMRAPVTPFATMASLLFDGPGLGLANGSKTVAFDTAGTSVGEPACIRIPDEKVGVPAPALTLTRSAVAANCREMPVSLSLVGSATTRSETELRAPGAPVTVRTVWLFAVDVGAIVVPLLSALAPRT